MLNWRQFCEQNWIPITWQSLLVKDVEVQCDA